MTFKVFFVSLLCYCHVIIKIKFYCCCFSVFILFIVVDLTTMWEFRQSLTVEMNLRDFLFLAFDFCRFWVVIRFFHPRHNGQWPPPSDFYTRLFSYLNSWERASIFPFECSVLNNGTPGTILYRLWYDAVLDWGLNPGPPALEANTIPLGYRGGGTNHTKKYI